MHNPILEKYYEVAIGLMENFSQVIVKFAPRTENGEANELA